MKRNLATQFATYLVVGGISALVDLGTLFGLHHFLGVDYLASAAVAFAFGLITNYVLSISMVFESKGKVGGEFALFALIGVGGLVWTEIILATMVSFAHLPLLLAKIVAVVLVLFWNFGMRRRFVFAPQAAASK